MLVKNIELHFPENPGCNNGNYVPWTGINAETGEAVSGSTCNCGAGCSGQDRLEGMDWETRTAELIEEEKE